MPPEPSIAAARRILVVRLDNAGDVIMTGPVFRALRSSLPSAELTLLCSPAGAEAAPLLDPWIDDVMVERVVWQDASARLPLDSEREAALIERLRERSFDVVLILTSFSQTPYPAAYAAYLAGIPVRVAQTTDFGGSVLTHAIPPLSRASHQVDRNLHLLDALRIDVPDRSLRLALPSAHQRDAGIRPHVVLAPTASCTARTYPAARFIEVGRALAPFASIVVTGRATDQEVCTAIADAIPSARSVAGETSFVELAGLIADADLLITNHSGPMHLAEAARTPSVVLFAGTDLESQWAPRDSFSITLREPTACAPCGRFVCNQHAECLDIPPARVVSAARELLTANARTRA